MENDVDEADQRPPVWVGHITLTTDCLEDSREFMASLGMRRIASGDGFAVLELRAGTHLVLLERDEIEPGVAPFDLMVENLDTTHQRLSDLGLAPSAISEGQIHRSFTVRDPSGHTISFNSSHVSDQPV
jgi:catechol 2,3-dioxygenase-like lactoylglutathione lyase family enzyme